MWGMNPMEPEAKAAFSKDKAAFKSLCQVAKHCRFLQVGRLQRAGAAALKCRVCARGAGSGVSEHERLAYACLDSEPLIEHYAVEAYSLTSSERAVLSDGKSVCIGQHRWDAMTLSPPNLLIEVHGEEHTRKLDTRAHNSDSSLLARQEQDWLLAAAAQAAGFSVLWLYEDASVGRQHLHARWAAMLREAVAHVRAERAPALFAA